jgi:hypothetical protein
MGNLRRALPWVAVFAVGLAPIPIYSLASVIGRRVRRKHRERTGKRVSPRR